MICPHCFKTILDEGAEFCPYCGKQFTENQPKLEGQTLPVESHVQANQSGGAILTLRPGLHPNEQILWRNDIFKGVFNKKLVRSYLVTNYRCYIIDGETNKVDGQLAIWVCDVTVMNSRRMSNSIGGGNFVGYRGVGSYGGSRSTTSRTFGDLHLISGGKQYMVFPDVADPNGVKRLIETLKKEYIKGTKVSK